MKRSMVVLCFFAAGCGPLAGQTQGVDPAITAAAQAGDQAAQYKLSEFYQGDTREAKNYEQAELWLERSADQGYTPALLRLTGRYENARDFTNAAKWYRKLAASNSPLSSSGDWQLGNYAALGLLGNPDTVEAAYRYRKAAEKGNCLGANSLGKLEQSGKLGPPDFSEVASWYHKAADGGCEDGASNLGSLYFAGQGVPKNLGLAALWWRKAAADGSAAADANIGFLYENGYGVKRDFVQAAFWFEKAAKANRYPSIESAAAEARLGMLYYYGGYGVPRNSIKAASWLTKAVSDGDDALFADQSFALAELYRRGEGVPQNFDKSLELYVQSGRGGFAYAQLYLAGAYCFGDGVSQDYPKAYYWFSLAALFTTGTKHTTTIQQRDLTALHLSPRELALQQDLVEQEYKLIKASQR